jgi:hypothetical protein
VFSSVIDVLLNVKSLFEHFDDEAMPRDRQQQYAKEILEDVEDAAEVSKDVQKWVVLPTLDNAWSAKSKVRLHDESFVFGKWEWARGLLHIVVGVGAVRLAKLNLTVFDFDGISAQVNPVFFESVRYEKFADDEIVSPDCRPLFARLISDKVNLFWVDPNLRVNSANKFVYLARLCAIMGRNCAITFEHLKK